MVRRHSTLHAFATSLNRDWEQSDLSCFIGKVQNFYDELQPDEQAVFQALIAPPQQS
jgi:hypothetical protein